MNMYEKFNRVGNSVSEVSTMADLAPNVAKASCEQFPLTEMAGHIGIEVVNKISAEEKAHQLPQFFEATFLVAKAEAFRKLGFHGPDRSQLSLEVAMRRDKHMDNIGNLQVLATNGQTYFCANIKEIRNWLQPMTETGLNMEGFAQALQMALVSEALKTGRPVMFVDVLVEEADKVAMGKADRYIMNQRRQLRMAPQVNVEELRLAAE